MVSRMAVLSILIKKKRGCSPRKKRKKRKKRKRRDETPPLSPHCLLLLSSSAAHCSFSLKRWCLGMDDTDEVGTTASGRGDSRLESGKLLHRPSTKRCKRPSSARFLTRPDSTRPDSVEDNKTLSKTRQDFEDGSKTQCKQAARP